MDMDEDIDTDFTAKAIKTHLHHEKHPIEPWNEVKQHLSFSLGLNRPAVKSDDQRPPSSQPEKDTSLKQQDTTNTSGVLGSVFSPTRSASDGMDDDDERKRLEDVQNASPRDSTDSNAANALALPIAIPHGFQSVRFIPHLRSTVTSALYIPGQSTVDVFVTQDSHHVHVWRGQTKVKRVSVIESIHETRELSIAMGGSGQGGLKSLHRWTYVKKYRLFIVASTHLQIRVLDNNLDELSNVVSAKPILWLEFIEDRDELIAGGVGNICVWKLKKMPEAIKSRTIYSLHGPRLNIEDIQDEWVTYTYYDQSTQRLYAACDNSVYVYDIHTGERIHSLKNIHEMAVTVMTVYEPNHILFTASKDHTIRVWNSNYSPLHTFRDHNGPVMGLILIHSDGKPPATCAAVDRDDQLHRMNIEIAIMESNHHQKSGASVSQPPGKLDVMSSGFLSATSSSLEARIKPKLTPVDDSKLPLLLSCSHDGTIRMWNIDSGQCVYKLETGHECLGMGFMRRDTFYSYNRKGIVIWNMNRFYSTYLHARSPVTLLRRTPKIPNIRDTTKCIPARLLSVSEDSSIRLISPVTADVIATCLPIQRDVRILDAVYSPQESRIFAFTHTMDIIVYSTTTNPCCIVDYYDSRDRNVNTKGDTSFSKAITSMQAGSSVKGNTLSDVGRIACISAWEPYLSEKYADQCYQGSLQPFWFLAGTNTGQLAIINTSQHGRLEMLAQAHSAPIFKISVDSKRDLVFSTTMDQSIKVWRIVPVTNGTSTVLTLNHVSTVSYRFGTPVVPLHINFHQNSDCVLLSAETPRARGQKQDSVVRNGYETVFHPVFPGGVLNAKQHPPDEDHTERITAIAVSEHFNIYVSSSKDGTVKVWDMTENTLLRELQFNGPIGGVEILNDRGDLVLALNESILLVTMQDYLPRNKLLDAVKMQFDDDFVEPAQKFDSDLDVLSIFKTESIRNENNMLSLNALLEKAGLTPLQTKVKKEEAKSKTSKDEDDHDPLLAREFEAYKKSKQFWSDFVKSFNKKIPQAAETSENMDMPPIEAEAKPVTTSEMDLPRLSNRFPSITNEDGRPFSPSPTKNRETKTQKKLMETLKPVALDPSPATSKPNSAESNNDQPEPKIERRRSSAVEPTTRTARIQPRVDLSEKLKKLGIIKPPPPEPVVEEKPVEEIKIAVEEPPKIVEVTEPKVKDTTLPPITNNKPLVANDQSIAPVEVPKPAPQEDALSNLASLLLGPQLSMQAKPKPEKKEKKEKKKPEKAKKAKKESTPEEKAPETVVENPKPKAEKPKHKVNSTADSELPKIVEKKEVEISVKKREKEFSEKTAKKILKASENIHYIEQNAKAQKKEVAAVDSFLPQKGPVSSGQTTVQPKEKHEKNLVKNVQVVTEPEIPGSGDAQNPHHKSKNGAKSSVSHSRRKSTKATEEHHSEIDTNQNTQVKDGPASQTNQHHRRKSSQMMQKFSAQNVQQSNDQISRFEKGLGMGVEEFQDMDMGEDLYSDLDGSIYNDTTENDDMNDFNESNAEIDSENGHDSPYVTDDNVEAEHQTVTSRPESHHSIKRSEEGRLSDTTPQRLPTRQSNSRNTRDIKNNSSSSLRPPSQGTTVNPKSEEQERAQEEIEASNQTAASEVEPELDVFKELEELNNVDFVEMTDEIRDMILKIIMSQLWFPKKLLVVETPTITDLIFPLARVLQDGAWLERIESCRALLYLYRCFPELFPSSTVFDTFIQPMLPLLTHSSWQVRVQAIACIGTFQCKTVEIVQALLQCAARETIGLVKMTIVTALAELGLDSRDTVRKFIFGSTNHGVKRGEDLVKPLIVERDERIHEKTMEKDGEVNQWISELKVQELQRKVRPSSYPAHLVMPSGKELFQAALQRQESRDQSDKNSISVYRIAGGRIVPAHQLTKRGNIYTRALIKSRKKVQPLFIADDDDIDVPWDDEIQNCGPTNIYLMRRVHKTMLRQVKK